MPVNGERYGPLDREDPRRAPVGVRPRTLRWSPRRVRSDDGRIARGTPRPRSRGEETHRVRRLLDLREPDAVRAERGPRTLPARPRRRRREAPAGGMRPRL